MEKFKNQKVFYPNLLSKILLKDSWLRQFHVPIPAPFIIRSIFIFIEKYFLRPDTSKVKIEKPIFILGPPRSGTTMLQDVMCAHPDMCYIMNIQNTFHESVYSAAWIREKLNLNVSGERYLQDSIIASSTTSSEPSMHWMNWTGRKIEDLTWNKLTKSNLKPEKIEVLYSVIKKVMVWFGGQNSTKRFFCKYPIFTTEFLLLNELFPDAKFIHIVRDGREVSNSLIKLYTLTKDQLIDANHPNINELIPYPRIDRLHEYIKSYGPESLDCTARVWSDCLDYVDENKHKLKYFHEVKYEDILKNPSLEMEKIWNFCEMKNPTNKEYLELFNKIGKITHKNSYKDYSLVEKIAEKNLRKYGYLK